MVLDRGRKITISQEELHEDEIVAGRRRRGS